MYINSCCVLYSGNGIVIGNDTLIAAGCILAPTNHEFEAKHRLIRDQGFRPSKGGIIIENDCWIGANSVLLDGAHLECGAVISAGSIIRGRVPSHAVCASSEKNIIKYRQ